MTRSTATIMLWYVNQIEKRCPDCKSATAHLRQKLEIELKRADSARRAAAARWVRKHELDKALDAELLAVLEAIPE